MNNNLEAILVKHILTLSSQACMFANMNYSAINVNKIFNKVVELENVLDESNAFGVSGGIWYDNNIKRVIAMLDDLDNISTNKGTGSSEAFSHAAELSELVEKLQARYNFN